MIKDIKLSKTQNAMVQENMKLAHYMVNSFLKKTNLYNRTNDYDDLFQIACFALCKAVCSFDPDKEFKFSSYASTIINNELGMLIRKNKQYIINTVSSELFYQQESCFDDDEPRKNEYLPNDDNSSFIMAELLKIKETYTGISKIGIEAIILTLNGYSGNEIAKKYNTTARNISAYISRARSKLKNEKTLTAYAYS